MAPSVACIINGDIPRAKHGPYIFHWIFIYFAFIFRAVRFPVRNLMTHAAERACEIIVAKAAPCTPISKPKINIGSRIILATAPITTLTILIPANPCVVIKELSPKAICTNRVPHAYIRIYPSAYPIVLSLAPNKSRRSFPNNRSTPVRIIPAITVPLVQQPRIRSAVS